MFRLIHWCFLVVCEILSYILLVCHRGARLACWESCVRCLRVPNRFLTTSKLMFAQFLSYFSGKLVESLSKTAIIATPNVPLLDDLSKLNMRLNLGIAINFNFTVWPWFIQLQGSQVCQALSTLSWGFAICVMQKASFNSFSSYFELLKTFAGHIYIYAIYRQ